MSEGKKVFWFGAKWEVAQLKERYKPFADAFFLQAFDISELLERDSLDSAKNFAPAVIRDGEGIGLEYRPLLDWLEENVPAFNVAQYRVEHSGFGANIVVKASAGTGKTTVMVDRILYLMHMVPDLKMSEIYMITFTNEATNQMNDRLQEMLLKKYSLTKNKKYLTWLEQQSQMHISTIDSLAYDLFRRFGTGVGFGRDLGIQPLERERKNLIKDLLSDQLDDTKAIVSQIGMNYSDASKVIDAYWKELTSKGYTISEVLKKDWGDRKNEPVLTNFQDIIKAVLKEFEGKYSQLKLDENAISIHDLFFDFGHDLLAGKVDCKGLNMKYLFVDEFQDTDATQIRTFARLVQRIGAKLFVVGDIKQSIYSFKGATDEAFDILDEEMPGRLKYYSLRNNYRTCANLMKVMEEYFFAWSKLGLLQYDEAVRPFNKSVGSVEMDYIEGKNFIQTQTMNLISSALSDLELEIRSGAKKVTDKTKVAVLVRGNMKATEIAELCRKHGKTVVLNSDCPFFLSQAVRDFYALISSYIFVEQPIYTYNYLMTPYASYDGVISVSEMEQRMKNGAGNGMEVSEYLSEFLSQTKWHEYQREFRLRPVVAVIKEIVEKSKVIERFIAMDKVRMYGDAWTEAKKNRQALIDAKSYQKNLDKLMEMIQQRMDGDFTTLYDLYVYLTLMIATNREEMEPDIEMENDYDYTSVYIMTVHKSKGLEFDTVIMPAMNRSLVPSERTTILAGKDKAAWTYEPGKSNQMKSQWYEELHREMIEKGVAEETRMLYVAMTRAVNRLILLVNDWSTYESWSSLIRKVGLINE
ncbi:ATP-dependent helicase [Brotaphodocola catenula]|uniref:UvrD-helicase domain-containing protein n=1 Tax=Brotaphodocola catenula TaxID=2885361 RepID=UPI0032C0D334